MRRALLLTALLALLCVPAAASAAARYEIRGAGYGHGIGMSQYGAYGMAKIGRNYQQILAHYYRGTVVSLTSPRSIRVLLQSGISRAGFSYATHVGSKRLNPSLTYVASSSGAGVLVRTAAGKRVARFAGPVRVTSSLGRIHLGGRALNGVTAGNYRGALELRGGGGVTVVNVLALEDYLRGVVPGEMPSSWLPEALKAQAVAARGYAISTTHPGAVFDVYPDTRSQMYVGQSGEAASTNRAVRSTVNQVVTYRGQAIPTFFFSTSGGKTESIQNVWYGATPEPYLRGVNDPYDRGAPRHRWTLGPYSRATISRKLGGLCRGSFRALKVLRRGFSPRIVSADVVCSRGTVRTTGAQLRTTLGLYDAWLAIVRVDRGSSARAKQTGSLVSRLFAPSGLAAGYPLTVR